LLEPASAALCAHVRLKTAKTLGITIPLPLLERTDEVIEQTSDVRFWGRWAVVGTAPARMSAFAVAIAQQQEIYEFEAWLARHGTSAAHMPKQVGR